MSWFAGYHGLRYGPLAFSEDFGLNSSLHFIQSYTNGSFDFGSFDSFASHLHAAWNHCCLAVFDD